MAFGNFLQNFGNRIPIVNRLIETDEEKRRKGEQARQKVISNSPKPSISVAKPVDPGHGYVDKPRPQPQITRVVPAAPRIRITDMLGNTLSSTPNPNRYIQKGVEPGDSLARRIPGILVDSFVQPINRGSAMIQESPVGRLFGPSLSSEVERLAARTKDPRLAAAIRTAGYQNILDQAGIGINDSKATIGRKAVSNIGGTAANFIPIGLTAKVASGAARPTTSAVAKLAAQSGTAGALGSGLATAGSTDDWREIAKSAAVGAGIGAALPVAATGAKVGIQSVSKNSVFNRLANETNPAKVATTLQKQGFVFDNIDDVARAIARAANENEVLNILTNPTDVAAGTTAAVVGRELFEQATTPKVVKPKKNEPQIRDLNIEYPGMEKVIPPGGRKPVVPSTNPNEIPLNVGTSAVSTSAVRNLPKPVVKDLATHLGGGKLSPERLDKVNTELNKAGLEVGIENNAPIIKAKAPEPVASPQSNDLSSELAKLPPAQKEELNKIAQQLGVKDIDELVKTVNQPQSSDIGSVTSAGVDVNRQIEENILGRQSEAEYKSRPITTLTEKYSPNRLARTITRPVENLVNSIARVSLESGNRTGRLFGRTLTGISRQAGRTRDELQRLAEYQGSKDVGDILAKRLAEQGADLGKSGVDQRAIFAQLDPELAKAKGIKISNLSSEQQSRVDAEASRLRDINDAVHEGNYQLGFLDDNTYQKNKGRYIARDATEFFKNDAARQVAKDNKLELNIFKTRDALADIHPDIIKTMEEDPYFLTAMRVQQYHRNKAYVDYSNWLAKNGSIAPGPRKGYVQVPDSPAYGALKGQFVLKEQLEDLQGFIYETGLAQHAVALLNAYDRNPLRRGRKAQLTIYNPGVRFGNRTFNYLITSMNGINPLTFTRNYVRANRAMKNNSPEYLEAAQQGIFGSTIIDKELYRSGELRPKGNVVQRAHGKVSDTYSKVDDESKLAIYITLRERGLSPQEAAERTRRSTQNYDLVGQLFDIGAKTPVLGNAFVRFSSELMRIAHNTAVDNPVRAAGIIASTAALIDWASRASGESSKDRKTREERLGAPRVPFTGQSLEVQTPWGAVNAGRLLGLTTYNDLVGGIGEDIKRLSPFQSPVTRDASGKLTANAGGLGADPLIGPLIQLGINRDFRGKNISDPDIAKYPSQPLTGEEQNKNRLNFLKMAYAPYANELDSGVSALRGKENYYGKERTPVQAGLRTFGIKVEKYGPKQAEEQRNRDSYFADLNEINKLAKALKSRDEQDVFRRYTTNEKKRGTSDPLVPKGIYDTSVRAQEMLKYPEVFGVLKKKAELDAKRYKLPVDPLYELPPAKREAYFKIQIANNTSPGSPESKKLKKDQESWYYDFSTKRSDYFDKVGKRYDELRKKGNNLPAQPLNTIQYPEVSKDTQAKLSKLDELTSENRGQFYKDNPDVIDFFKKHDNYIRQLRAERGLPQFDKYPVASPELQKIIDEYSSLPKNEGHVKRDGTRASDKRSAWIKAHPSEWAAMTEQFSKQALYNLQNDAARAIYEDEDLSEKGIKSIQSLAKSLGMSGGSGGLSFGYGFVNGGSSVSAPNITNLLGSDGISAPFGELPKIKIKDFSTVRIPKASTPKKINISSLILPTKAPTLRLRKRRK